MKRYLCTLILALITLCCCWPNSALAAPQLASTAAVLMDGETGQILFEKNMDQRMYPASITKILTILLAVENSTPQQQVVVSEQAVMSLPLGTSHIGLQPGEKVSMEDLLYAAAMMSANDACNVIAEEIAGSMEAFAEMMNQRAAALGCTGSNFVNAHGLSEVGHYSSAHDMALITQAALRNAEFRQYFGMVIWEMGTTNMVDETRPFATQHDMLKQGEYYYQGADGGKTGYTSLAQNTLVTTAQRDGRRLITVIMQCASGQERYSDTALLLDYGFNEFLSYTIPLADIIDIQRELPEAEESSVVVDLQARTDFTYLLHNSLNSPKIIQTPVMPEVWTEAARATLRFSLAEPNSAMYYELGRIPLEMKVISRQTPATGFIAALLMILKFVFKVLLIIIGLLFLLVVVLRGRKLWRDQKKRRRGIANGRGNNEWPGKPIHKKYG